MYKDLMGVAKKILGVELKRAIRQVSMGFMVSVFKTLVF